MKKKKIILLIGCTILIGIYLWGWYENKQLKNHGIILNAKTLEWATVSKGRVLKYEFYYKGEKKESSNSIESIRGMKDFENKYFPVIYDPKYGSSQILIEPSEFKRFNIPFPDSLQWVLKYLK